jgi:hypothetical protein
MRNNINIDRIQELALEQDTQMTSEREFYFTVIEQIKNAIEDIDAVNKKITLPRIAERLQLAFQGITPTELWNSYRYEIVTYAEQYD